MVAMVAPENDNRLFAQLQSIELVEHAPDLRVHEAGRGPVSTNHLAGLSGRSVASNKEIRIAMRNRDLRESGRRLRMGIEVDRQRNLVNVVEVEELFRRRRWAVRLVEANGEKEWLVFVSTQVLDRACRDFV